MIFEDTVRRLSEKRDVKQTSRRLDDLLSELTEKGVLSALERKAAAGIRNAATHPQWDTFNRDQVISTINFVRRLTRDKLAR